MVNYRLELGYRPFPMSSKNHHFQLNCLAKVSFICMRISLFTDVYRLAVSKSPAVYTLSPALDGLWRENRGSVNRLYENKSNHFHVKGFALTLACSTLRDSLVRGDLESGRDRVFPTIWEPGAGYTHDSPSFWKRGFRPLGNFWKETSPPKKVKKKIHHTYNRRFHQKLYITWR